MKFRSFLLVPFLCMLISSTHGQKGPLSADEIMQEACQQAAREKKNVLIIFHASWCVWCHRMDSSIYDQTCRKFFDNNYVIRYMVVDEHRDKKNLENPGADEFRAKYNGEGKGIPFWLIFDKDENLLADSQFKPEGASPETNGYNVGCPATESEVAQFINILKRTSTIKMSEQKAIEKRFRKNQY